MVELNWIIASGMANGFEAALERLDRLRESKRLEDYALLSATRADFLRRLNRFAEASADYRRAIELTRNGSERRYLETRLLACEKCIVER